MLAISILKVLKLHSTLGKSTGAQSSMSAAASSGGELCLVTVVFCAPIVMSLLSSLENHYTDCHSKTV